MATSIKRSKSRAASVEGRNMCRLDTIRNMASGEVSWPIPMRAIGAQNLLTMPGGVKIAGYLHKRGGKQLQLFKWPLRYVIIHKGCVYYFKTSTSAASQGAFSLNGYNRVMRAAEETTSDNVFPFKMAHISKKHRTWYFSAASEEERKKWMLALRKEIDRYHEKKETITDLSDSGSETDSFYGSVERPVDIKYTQSPAEDSWQDDDDDEADYEEPDVTDTDIAPSYPPPPVPSVQENDLVSNRPSTARIIGAPKPKLPSPPSRSYPVYPRYSVGGVQDPGGRPPIPALPPAHKPNESIRSTDKAEKDPKNDHVRPPSNVGKKPPVLPQQPPVHRVEPLPPQPRKDIISSQPKETVNNPPYMSGNSFKINDELINRFNITGPAIPEKPPKKPNHVNTPVPPIRPTKVGTKTITMDSNVPQVPRKPRGLSETLKLQEESSPPLFKPIAVKSPTTIPRPPTLPRLQPRRTESDLFSPTMRSPPDGQSVRDITVELPVRPAKPKKIMGDTSDSDDDYEKVPLPASVFVDTCDSFDVERMFKATDARGSPLNGLFCIRNSAKAGKVLVVWDKMESKLRNYRVFEKDSSVYLESENLFTDLATLVEHYYGNTLPSHDRLVLKYAYGSPSISR
ncbi:SH3 domain-binding protein 2 isoform X1 [Bufo bufo]|uniref:SH3 domain-binding protein 2 isoform X1 n=2 Tax=Bufo bufo TaxID=8384 RepID=UPI001ABEB059|nr:SH3 domain-binding protein 2 isoform X1 [Bufo bufo]